MRPDTAGQDPPRPDPGPAPVVISPSEPAPRKDNPVPDTHRLDGVVVATSTYLALVEEATADGISLPEAIRRGTQLLRIVREARTGGFPIQLVDPATGKVRDLELR